MSFAACPESGSFSQPELPDASIGALTPGAHLRSFKRHSRTLAHASRLRHGAGLTIPVPPAAAGREFAELIRLALGPGPPSQFVCDCCDGEGARLDDCAAPARVSTPPSRPSAAT